jgi:hypothetical protein
LHRKHELVKLCELAQELDLEKITSTNDYELSQVNRRPPRTPILLIITFWNRRDLWPIHELSGHVITWRHMRQRMASMINDQLSGSIVFFFLILLTNKQNLTSRCWLFCPELGNFRGYQSLLMLNVLFPEKLTLTSF